MAGTFRGGNTPSRASAPTVLTRHGIPESWEGREVITQMPAKKKAAKKKAKKK